MIRSIHIENFKSVVDLTLDLGRFNILIGENGCGKSNILEAIGFAGAAVDRKLDNEFLNSRGMRVPNAQLFVSVFENNNRPIIFKISTEDFSFDLVLGYDKIKKEWVELTRFTTDKEFDDIYKWIFSEILPQLSNDFLDKPTEPIQNTKEGAMVSSVMQIFQMRNESGIKEFLIYSPENSYLRKFEEEGQILPLGIKGEGLFSEIKRLLNSLDNESLKDIKENLSILDWFEDFIIPSDNFANEYRIQIKDRYLEGEIQYFDQRSANEGFLFLLFYLTLFTSDKTPAFFAIDNIEASFNPKMCIKLIEVLNELSIKYHKQVIITTHNPAILDGLNLNDREQRLFVIRRNIDGHTIATHIAEKPKTVNEIKLSEMWTRGLLGGLPNNF